MGSLRICLLLSISVLNVQESFQVSDYQEVTIDVNKGKQGIVGSDLIATFFSTTLHSFIRIQFYFEEPLHPINVFRVETNDKDASVSMELKILDDLVVLETRKDAISVSNLILGTLKQNSLQNLTLHFHGSRVSLMNFCDHLSTKELDRNFLNVLATRPFILRTFYEHKSLKNSHLSYRDVSLFQMSTSVRHQLTYQHQCYKEKKTQEDKKKPKTSTKNTGEKKAAYSKPEYVYSGENLPDSPLGKLTRALELLKEVEINQELQVATVQNFKSEVKNIKQGVYDADDGVSSNDLLAQLLKNTRAENRDACASNPCFFLVPCFSTTDSIGYQCGSCPLGMEGDGKKCKDINECVFNPCSSLTTCTNINGGYTCSKCPPGFKGQPVYGRGKDYAKKNKQVCEDHNECEVFPSVCPQRTYCNNTIGGFYCTACDEGFVLNKFGKCVQIRQCKGLPRSSKNPCSEFAHCSYEMNDLIGGEVKACKCYRGYAGNGFHCGSDTDYDGFPDEDLECETKIPGCVRDNCPTVPNSDQLDNDFDGFGDVCDDDDDDDGVLDVFDNCPLIPNKKQVDFDKDGVGDICDNCPISDNRLQTDSDKDGYGDACDIDIDNDGLTNELDNCPFVANDDQRDIDSDGVGDDCDNCPSVKNPEQLDMTKNGIGDVCDSPNDRDLDGVSDIYDNCPHFPNAAQVDTDNDKIGNKCDDDDDNDGFVDQGDNCPLMHNLLQFDIDDNKQGDICEYDYDDDGYDSRVDTCPMDMDIWQTDFRQYDIVTLDGNMAENYARWQVLDQGRHVELKDLVPGKVTLLGRDVYEGFDFKGVIYIHKNPYIAVDSEVGIVFNYQNTNQYYLFAIKSVYRNSIASFYVKNLKNRQVQKTHNSTMYWNEDIQWSFDKPYRVEISFRPLNNQVKLRVESPHGGGEPTPPVETLLSVPKGLQGGRIGLYVSHENKVIWSALQIECNEAKL